MTYTGCDTLREWLQAQGFKIAGRDDRLNVCNWYAYRQTALPARECECNDGKPIQIVVRPFSLDLNGQRHESVEMDVVGQAGGRWYEFKAYSIKPHELMGYLSEIEGNLIAAWNAIGGGI